jgi:ABC-type uncharacterized transport system auxiliary subunit
MRPTKRTLLSAAILALLMITVACSSKPFLIVHYQLPSSSDTLAGKEMSLVINDTRENKAFLGESAGKSLREFNDTFSLVVLKEDGSGNLLGVYGIKPLISEIFKQRLINLGMQVPSPAIKSDYELEIILKEFQLNLAGRKWVVNMNYQANLLKNGKILAVEAVNGSAERLKVMGKSDAEKVLGELVTDMVNKLDLAKMMEKAWG